MRQIALLSFLLFMPRPAHTEGSAASQPSSAPASASRFHLLFTADIFGRFAWPGCTTPVEGKADLAHLIAVVQQRKRAISAAGAGRPLVVGAGSTIRPDALGNFIFNTDDALANEAAALLSRVGFDALGLGPFDLGAKRESLHRYLQAMKAHGLQPMASNVSCRRKSDFRCREMLSGPKGYRVFSRGGLKIGVFGLIGDDLSQRIRPETRGSLVVERAIVSARRILRALRSKEKVDLVVALASLNTESNAPLPVIDFARKIGADAPDIIVANAMFERGRKTFIASIDRAGPPLIVGTDRFGQTLGEVVIPYRRLHGKVILGRMELRRYRSAAARPAPEDRRRGRKLLRTMCRALHRPLGAARIAGRLDKPGFFSYILNVLRQRQRAEIAVLNESALADTAFPMRGKLTKEALLRAIRTETTVGYASISGKRVLSLLKPHIAGKAGLHVVGLKRSGRRVTVNGRPVVAGDRYRVAMTAFVASGGDGLLPPSAGYVGETITLRDLLISFFEGGGTARDGDPRLDLERDFPQLADKWLISMDLDLGVGLTNVKVENGNDGKRYALPLLSRDDLTSLKLELGLNIDASTRDHSLAAELRLQYGHTWTTLQGGSETTSAETLDRILASVVYRLKLLRNRYGGTDWFVPEPYVEALYLSEFTPSGVYDEVKEYRYADLAGTIGLGFALHPALFAKAGFVIRGELLTPKRAKPLGISTQGLYLGYSLRRIKLITSRRHPLQLESRLDFYFTDFSDNLRRELTVQSKVYFALTRQINLSLTHRLFYFKTKGISESFANDITFGLDLLLDYRRQTF